MSQVTHIPGELEAGHEIGIEARRRLNGTGLSRAVAVTARSIKKALYW